MKNKLMLCACALAAGLVACQSPEPAEEPAVFASANPYLPVWEFIPDGEPYVFEDPDHPGQYRVYVYGSHDVLQNSYCGRDQVVWSASVDDLTHWRYDGVILEVKQNARGELLNKDGVGDVLFAPDVTMTVDAQGKKTYWLYPNNMAEGRRNLVARSDRPDGPFTPCNWSKEDPNKTEGVMDFDPGVFVDDDGRVYGYFGYQKSCCAELDPATMATVKPGTQIHENMIPSVNQDGVERFFEASSIRKVKDKYVFIYSRTTAEGENGLPSSNYTLAYCYSNQPLGPWTYGGTIIDGRAREKQADGSVICTASPNGNTHGSICEINGQWYVFYHRQSGTDEFSRQAMVAPISVEVTEGPEGAVKISEAEFTSEGFNLQGLDPFQRYPAGIACYYVGPEPAQQEYPNYIYSGSHIGNVRLAHYDGKTDPYAVSLGHCSMVNNTSGSTVGYKYFNLDRTHGKKHIQLVLHYRPEGVAGTMDIYVDQPGKGGKKVQTLEIPALKGQSQKAVLDLSALESLSGKHALYFVFRSETPRQSVCTLDDFYFTAD